MWIMSVFSIPFRRFLYFIPCHTISTTVSTGLSLELRKWEATNFVLLKNCLVN